MTQPAEREILLLAVYREPSGQLLLESNARTEDELSDAIAFMATAYARVLARPGSEPERIRL